MEPLSSQTAARVVGPVAPWKLRGTEEIKGVWGRGGGVSPPGWDRLSDEAAAFELSLLFARPLHNSVSSPKINTHRLTNWTLVQ